MIKDNRVVSTLLLMAAAISSGCVSRPPTIAHVHLGHALTGVHVTPGRVGYLAVAEERALQAAEAAHAAARASSLAQLKPAVAAAAHTSNSE
jgi:hypothetical protein